MLQGTLDKEDTELERMFPVARAIVTKAIENERPEFVAGTSFKLADMKKTWRRLKQAEQNRTAYSEALLEGLIQKFAAKTRNDYPVLKRMHALPKGAGGGAAAMAKKHEKAVERKRQRSKNEEARKAGSVPLEDSLAQFMPATYGRKSAVVNELLGLGDLVNAKIAGERAVHIMKTQADRKLLLKKLVEKSRGDDDQETGFIKIIDYLQCIQTRPAARPNRPDTLCELARSIIIDACKKFDNQTKVVALVIDAAEFMTALRIIQQLKRGKVQDDVEIQSAIYGALGGAEILRGAFADKMKNKHGFVVQLCRQVAYELKNDNKDEDWIAPLKRGQTLIFAGGANLVEVRTHSAHRREVKLFTNCPSITVTDIKIALRDVPKQGEGERMAFRMVWLLFHLARTKVPSGKTLAPLFLVESSDADAVLAHMPPTVHAIRHALQKTGYDDDLWHGRLLLRIHPKSSEVMASMGACVDQGNISVPVLVDGRNLELVIDCEKLYLAIEGWDALAEFNNVEGCRALSLTGGIMTQFGADYISHIRGIGCRALFDALLSPRFSKLAASLLRPHHLQGGSLVCISFPEVDGIAYQIEHCPKYRLSYHGVALLLYVALMGQPAVRKQLQLRYTEDQLDSGQVTYDVVRAAAQVALLRTPPPSEAVIITRISVATAVYEQFANHIFVSDPPAVRGDEIAGTPFIRSSDGSVTVQYRPHVTGALREERVVAVLEEQYKNIYTERIPVFEPEEDGEGSVAVSWPFRLVRDVLEEAIRNKGGEPLRSVNADEVYCKEVMLEGNDVDKLELSSCGTSDVAKSVDQNKLFVAAIQATLLHHTSYEKCSTPLLGRATVEAVSSGRDAWEKMEWDCDERREKYSKETLSKVMATAVTGDNEAKNTLLDLVRHVIASNVENLHRDENNCSSDRDENNCNSDGSDGDDASSDDEWDPSEIVHVDEAADVEMQVQVVRGSPRRRRSVGVAALVSAGNVSGSARRQRKRRAQRSTPQ